MTQTPVCQRQECVVEGWVPDQITNGDGKGRWKAIKARKAAKIMAWTTAKQAGWTFMPGRVRLTVVYVFSVKRKRDVDNLYARSVGLVNGLKGVFFEDDDTSHLDLVVRAEVVPGQKCTRIEMEALT